MLYVKLLFLYRYWYRIIYQYVEFFLFNLYYKFKIIFSNYYIK